MATTRSPITTNENKAGEIDESLGSDFDRLMGKPHALEDRITNLNERLEQKIADLLKAIKSIANPRSASSTSEERNQNISSPDYLISVPNQAPTRVKKSGTMQDRFEDIRYDHIAELKLLQETDGIEDYHRKFDLIRSKVDLPEAYLVEAFLAGLSADTQLNVKMFQPQTVRQCLSIGRLYEVAHPLKRIVPSVTTEQITKTEKEDAFIQVNALLDANQEKCSKEELKISEENVKIARFQLLETEKLKKKESALRVQLKQDLDDIGFQEDSFEATMEHEHSALHGKATFTTHSTVADANLQFNSSSINGSADDMEEDHASHVWHRWKNKESYAKTLIQNKGIDADELETTFVNVQSVGAARLTKQNSGKDEDLKRNTDMVESLKVDKGLAKKEMSDKSEIEGTMGGTREETKHSFKSGKGQNQNNGNKAGEMKAMKLTKIGDVMLFKIAQVTHFSIGVGIDKQQSTPSPGSNHVWDPGGVDIVQMSVTSMELKLQRCLSLPCCSKFLRLDLEVKVSRRGEI